MGDKLCLDAILGASFRVVGGSFVDEGSALGVDEFDVEITVELNLLRLFIVPHTFAGLLRSGYYFLLDF
jgi:hypothetical protein